MVVEDFLFFFVHGRLLKVLRVVLLYVLRLDWLHRRLLLLFLKQRVLRLRLLSRQRDLVLLALLELVLPEIVSLLLRYGRYRGCTRFLRRGVLWQRLGLTVKGWCTSGLLRHHIIFNHHHAIITHLKLIVLFTRVLLLLRLLERFAAHINLAF